MYPPFQVRRPSVPKKIRHFRLPLFLPVLPQWTCEALMKALICTRLQHASFETIRKKTVLACGFQSKERCSTSGFGGLQRCSIWMAHVTTCLGCRLPNVLFRWQENIERHKVHTMTLKLSLLTGPGFFPIGAAECHAFLLVCSVCQLYIFYCAAEMCILAKALWRYGFTVMAFSVFVNHGRL